MIIASLTTKRTLCVNTFPNMIENPAYFYNFRSLLSYHLLNSNSLTLLSSGRITRKSFKRFLNDRHAWSNYLDYNSIKTLTSHPIEQYERWAN